MRPYDQLPFQCSVHVLREPGVDPEHHEFLATDASDPRREFMSRCATLLGESGNIVVYSAFESQRLSELAAYLPEFADRIKQIQARLWDLLPVVRNNVYHPAFAGSYSLKYVLPALVPEMTYDGYGGREWTGCRTGMGVSGTREPGCDERHTDQEGVAGVLRTGHAGDGQVDG